jgi:hypothetical protein
MSFSIKKIAKEFSTGNFDSTFQYLSDNVQWNIIGQNFFQGKTDVILNCKNTAQYFKSVKTNFLVEDILTHKNKVVVIGTAEFLRDGERLDFVYATDIYEFNEDKMINKISSYCISEKK